MSLEGAVKVANFKRAARLASLIGDMIQERREAAEAQLFTQMAAGGREVAGGGQENVTMMKEEEEEGGDAFVVVKTVQAEPRQALKAFNGNQGMESVKPALLLREGGGSGRAGGGSLASDNALKRKLPASSNPFARKKQPVAK